MNRYQTLHRTATVAAIALAAVPLIHAQEKFEVHETKMSARTTAVRTMKAKVWRLDGDGNATANATTATIYFRAPATKAYTLLVAREHPVDDGTFGSYGATNDSVYGFMWTSEKRPAFLIESEQTATSPHRSGGKGENVHTRGAYWGKGEFHGRFSGWEDFVLDFSGVATLDARNGNRVASSTGTVEGTGFYPVEPTNVNGFADQGIGRGMFKPDSCSTQVQVEEHEKHPSVPYWPAAHVGENGKGYDELLPTHFIGTYTTRRNAKLSDTAVADWDAMKRTLIARVPKNQSPNVPEYFATAFTAKVAKLPDPSKFKLGNWNALLAALDDYWQMHRYGGLELVGEETLAKFAACYARLFELQVAKLPAPAQFALKHEFDLLPPYIAYSILEEMGELGRVSTEALEKFYGCQARLFDLKAAQLPDPSEFNIEDFDSYVLFYDIYTGHYAILRDAGRLDMLSEDAAAKFYEWLSVYFESVACFLPDPSEFDLAYGHGFLLADANGIYKEFQNAGKLDLLPADAAARFYGCLAVYFELCVAELPADPSELSGDHYLYYSNALDAYDILRLAAKLDLPSAAAVAKFEACQAEWNAR